MTLRITPYIGICLFFLVQLSFGQVQKADKQYELYQFSDAIPLYEKYLKKSPDDQTARYKLADCYKRINYIAESIGHLEILASAASPKEAVLLDLVDQLRKEERLSEASTIANQLNSAFPSKTSQNLKQSIAKHSEFMTPTEKYSVKNLTNNTEYSSMAPISVGQNLWVVTSEKSGNQTAYTGRNTTNLFLTSSNMSSMEILAKELTLGSNNGLATYTPNRQEIYFHTTHTQGVKKGSIQTYHLKIKRAKKEENGWVVSDDFPWNNPEYNVAHPHLSADGNTLFFSSNKEDSKGGMDLYYCKKAGNTWSTPVNIAALNTTGNELYPVQNGNMLYFSSNGHLGLGGLDLYSSRINGEQFSTPENMHFPFNTSFDDFHISPVSNSGNAYVSSNRSGTHTLDDIFLLTKKTSTPPPPPPAPTPKLAEINTVTILVADKYTQTPLPYAKVVFINSNGETMHKGLTGPDGKVSVDHLSPGDYTVTGELNDVSTTRANIAKTDFQEENIERTVMHNDPRFTLKGLVKNTESGTPIPGAAVYRDNLSLNIKADNETLDDGMFFFQLEQASDYKVYSKKPGWLSSQVAYVSTKGLDRTQQLYVELNLDLQKPEENKVIKLDKIFYALNKCDINEKSGEELDRLYELMTEYTDMRIQLNSHTDSRASDAYNLKLSQCRADAAIEYLLNKGISADRLIGKGYGESKLTNDCGDGKPCSEAQHQMNRRTEFEIMSCGSCP